MNKLSWTTKLSYGIGAFGKDVVYYVCTSYLMFFLTDLKGLAPTFVGTLFLGARIFDAINDPIMGGISDNTRSRFGRFRPWIMIGAVLNAVVLVLLFLNTGFSGTAYSTYVAVLYILWGMTYTINDIPFWSMIAALTDDSQERDQVTSLSRAFSSLASLLVGSAGFAIVGYLGKGNQADGFSRIAIFAGIIFIITSTITFFNCHEMKITTQNDEKFTFKQMFGVLIKNDQLRVVFGFAITFYVEFMLLMGFATFYFKYVTGSADGKLFSIYSFCAGITMFVTALLFPLLTSRIGRQKTILFSVICQVVGLALLFICGVVWPSNRVMLAICSIIINLGVGFMLVWVSVSLADVVDYGEYKLGTRNNAVVFSMQTFSVKLAGALAGFLSGVGLSVIGYVANETPSTGTVTGMRVLMIVIPIVLVVISYLIYAFSYKLKGDFLKEVKATIDARRDAVADKEERQ